MRALLLSLVFTACVTPGLPATRAVGTDTPSLERLEARVGLSETEIDAAVRANLGELSRCIAFAQWGTQGAAVRVQNPEQLDDRVQVRLDARVPDGFYDGPFEVQVESFMSNGRCVERAVRAWRWPKAQSARTGVILTGATRPRRRAPTALDHAALALVDPLKIAGFPQSRRACGVSGVGSCAA